MKVKFIGPSAAAIHGMGDKIESKRVAHKAGVHIVIFICQFILHLDKKYVCNIHV